MKDPNQLFTSQHFYLDPLADGVFAAIHKEGGWAIANAGIIDLGDITLVYDSFMTPAAAEDLGQAAETLTGRPVSIVVNSHYHNDHIWGNQAFGPDVKVVSTTTVREEIKTRGRQEYDWYFEHSAGELARIKGELAEDPDPDRRRQLEFWVPYFQGLAETMPTLEVRYPTVTFRERMVINGSKRRAEIRSLGGGHTGDDAFLVLPEEGIAFLADLLFVGTHPFLADGDPDALVSILAQIADLKPKVLVPGHGPTGGPADLEANIAYTNVLQELAEGLPEGEAGQEALEALKIPAAFAGWDLPNFFEINMRFLHGRRAK
ncbi:MAG: MBL fold metallo-hydrolase [Anaerolineales bacterium]|nr:MBL fold metallo-hydrolase [Anaerolineales bacterium]